MSAEASGGRTHRGVCGQRESAPSRGAHPLLPAPYSLYPVPCSPSWGSHPWVSALSAPPLSPRRPLLLGA